MDPIALRGFLWAGTGGCHTASKVATFRDDVEVEEVFTSRTVRTRGTVFPSFGSACTRGARPDEVEGPSLALRRLDVETEEAEGNRAPGEEMQDDGGREQPDPEELRRPAAEVSAEFSESTSHDDGRRGAASAEQRRRITVKGPARPEEGREQRQSGGGR